MAEPKGFNLADVLKAVPKTDTGSERIERIDIDRLVDDPRNFYQLSDLDGLVENIELIGLQQPLRVRPDPEAPGQYVIVSGHRRRAAIRRLVGDGREDLRMIPCIVEQPAESEAMQELRLIFANSGTRKLTDAELSTQAERVTELLYKLKEEGVEFPGRMRDHVAEACQVSKSKLARLAVIRQGLSGQFLQKWQEDNVNESAAYALARMPTDLQDRIASVSKGKVPDGYTLDKLQKRVEKTHSWWQPTIQCPDGKDCTHADGFLRRALEDPWNENCDGTMCCLTCPKGAKCDHYACDRMCSRAKSARTARKSDEKAKVERAEERRITKIQKASIPYARRITRAADAAGLPDDVRLNWDYSSFTLGQIRQWADGAFPDYWPSYRSIQLMPKDLSHPLEAAKTLQCSADYLLGLTDELHPTASPEPLEYREGPGPEGKRQDAVGILDFGDGLDLYRCIITWDGKEWAFLGNITFEGKLVGWYPIPDTPKAPEKKAFGSDEEPENSVNPELSKMAPCYTGLSPSGYCGAAAHCGSIHRCCSQCDEDCNLRCGWISKEAENEQQ